MEIKEAITKTSELKRKIKEISLSIKENPIKSFGVTDNLCERLIKSSKEGSFRPLS